jgi:hypothetical protein
MSLSLSILWAWADPGGCRGCAPPSGRKCPFRRRVQFSKQNLHPRSRNPGSASVENYSRTTPDVNMGRKRDTEAKRESIQCCPIVLSELGLMY